MLNNDISSRYYVKHGFVLNIQVHRMQILHKFLVILWKNWNVHGKQYKFTWTGHNKHYREEYRNETYEELIWSQVFI